MTAKRGGGRSGGYACRTETLALAADGPQKFRHSLCETCNEERLFRGMKCTFCGVMRKIMTPRGEVARLTGQKTLRQLSAVSCDRRQTVLAEKKAYYARLAAESRAKFEGNK